MRSSGTSAPASMCAFARAPSGVPSRTFARSRSPVEMCATSNVLTIFFDSVPLPPPGGPMMSVTIARAAGARGARCNARRADD